MQGSWIWCRDAEPNGYNQTMMARRCFEVASVAEAQLAITADTRYRLSINGEWVNDGPARAWPEHYSYDLLDVTAQLREGQNEILVIANWYGVGTFHQVPRQPGLLAWLDVMQADGTHVTLGTDASWHATQVLAWISDTPKISIQMGPLEVIDCRRMERLHWAPAREVCGAGDGPWQDLQPRDVALLTREPSSPVACTAVNRIARRDSLTVSMNMVRILHPEVIEANRWISHAGALTTILSCPANATVNLELEDARCWLDGIEQQEGPLRLSAGDHLLLIAPRRHFSHDRVQSLRILPFKGLGLGDPLGEESAGFWRLVRFPGISDYVATDHLHDEATEERLTLAWEAELAELARQPSVAAIAHRLERLPAGALLVDPYPDFERRVVIGDASGQVSGPAEMMSDHAGCTLIEPDPAGDVELVFDLGVQRCGYWEIDLVAPAGTIVDLAGVEYLTPDGKLQHTDRNRNLMRCITAAGRNHLVSMRRRSARYLFLTLRRQTGPVRIRLLRVIESTYPVQAVGSFQASDERLTRIWEISARTLKLCMEDTFVDCPLYEQTLWIGDARNEALFAYTAFGAPDIARRCIRLGGESLEHYPMVGSQVPTCWDIVLPAWSFLWTISVWDHYLYTGDRDWLREAWPWVVRNLQGAERHTNDAGLFSAPFWNLFDWNGIDQDHETVTHNTMLAIGAVDAAMHCAEVLAATTELSWLSAYRQRLADGVNALWRDDSGVYPDSVHEDGTISPSSCQHTSALALLYDIAPPEHQTMLVDHLIEPPADMVRVGSPFAIQYIYEALEKAGRHEAIIDSIYDNYLPMLEAGATTVWETFPRSTFKPGEFPTRSHCHAWSSAPVYFLNRIILGIRSEAPGGTHFSISPRPCGLTWASGATATPHGPLRVAWRLDEQTLRLTIQTPPGVSAIYQPNAELAALHVVVT